MHTGSGVVVEPVRALAGPGGGHLESRPRATGDDRRAAADGHRVAALGSRPRDHGAAEGVVLRRADPRSPARDRPHERPDARAGVRHLGRVHGVGRREPGGRPRRGDPGRRHRPDEQRPALVYPSTGAPGATPDSENWVLDNFGRDPVTGRAMLATAEHVAGEGRIEKAELDDLAVRRYGQYLDALADDRAFQREWMVPIVDRSRRKPAEIAEDWGVRPIVREELEALGPVAGGRGGQLRHADPPGRRLRRHGREHEGRARQRGLRRPGGADPRHRHRAGRARRDAEGARARGARRAGVGRQSASSRWR